MDADGFAGAGLLQLHAAAETARGKAKERDPVAMIGVHVRLHLEDETADVILPRRNGAALRGLFTRGRCMGGKPFDQRADAEILQGRAEEHRA